MDIVRDAKNNGLLTQLVRKVGVLEKFVREHQALFHTSMKINGWVNTKETWTRTGNYTFTVSGDYTAVLSKGTKVRYKDGGSYEYGVVKTSTYSAPNTTVTLITNTNYAMAAGTITDTYYSYALKPEGFPAYFNWTPTFTNLTVGNGTLTSRLNTLGTNAALEVEFILGSTSSISGSVSHTLPVDPLGGVAFPLGVVICRDLSPANQYIGVIQRTSAGQDALLVVTDASGAYAARASLSSTIPFTWATGDVILATYSYIW